MAATRSPSIATAAGNFSWLNFDPVQGVSSGGVRGYMVTDVRRPLGWTLSPEPESEPLFQVYLLQEDPVSHVLSLKLHQGTEVDPDPQTIPVKFPDDPPIG